MTQVPDTKPGNYYVTVRNDIGNTTCLLGPFVNDHARALSMVDDARRVACERDTRGHWYSYGTVRVTNYNRPGLLNHLVPPCADLPKASAKRLAATGMA